MNATTRYSINRAKKVCYFDEKAKNNFSPGAGNYKLVEAAYSKISLSPGLSKKRH